MTTSGIGATQISILPSTVYLGGYRVESHNDVYPDGKECVVATHPDLPGCVGYGDDYSEACQMLEEARRIYINSLKEHGEEVPESLFASVRSFGFWHLNHLLKTSISGCEHFL